MSMTMTQKILAAHAGLDSVETGQLISAKLDLVLGNDITTPVAVNEFRKAGIAVYIVSGSFQDAVLAGSDGRYGVAFPAENVFGIHMKHDAQGRLAGWADDRFPLPWAEGKPDVIRRQIAVRHHGKAPILVAGDANGDYAMLTAFDDIAHLFGGIGDGHFIHQKME